MSNPLLFGGSNGPAASSSASVRVRAPARLAGTLRLPGDKSISHRALLLAALAQGQSLILGANQGADVKASATLIETLGVQVDCLERRELIEEVGWAGAPAQGLDYLVNSPGAAGLLSPLRVIDCANSGTTMRLGAGLLAGLPLMATLDGDGSLRHRPMARIITPLSAMGAQIESRTGGLAPLTISGRRPLGPIDYRLPIASAQVKSAILLAALAANGRTTIHEYPASRDHTERMLRARGVRVERTDADGLITVGLEGGSPVAPAKSQVPGDLSSAVFWLVAACLHPQALISAVGVGINPSRRAILDLLLQMGADISIEPQEPGREAPTETIKEMGGPIGEPTANLIARSSRLSAIEIGPTQVAAAIDEIPILALAATQAMGTTAIRGAGELRHKESDRLAGIAAGLAALGAKVAIAGDDLLISGPTRLTGTTLDSAGDHRLALTFAIAGLIASGETTITGAAVVDVSYPGFFATLATLAA